jgi:hypothetical protein
MGTGKKKSETKQPSLIAFLICQHSLIVVSQTGRVWHRYTVGWDFPHCTCICVVSSRNPHILIIQNYYYYYYNVVLEGGIL